MSILPCGIEMLLVHVSDGTCMACVLLMRISARRMLECIVKFLFVGVGIGPIVG